MMVKSGRQLLSRFLGRTGRAKFGVSDVYYVNDAILFFFGYYGNGDVNWRFVVL